MNLDKCRRKIRLESKILASDENTNDSSCKLNWKQRETERQRNREIETETERDRERER